MGNAIGLLSTLSFIESILRIMTYIAFISVSFKALQALNIYINKNSR